jgi:hypothetical protein
LPFSITALLAPADDVRQGPFLYVSLPAFQAFPLDKKYFSLCSYNRLATIGFLTIFV